MFINVTFLDRSSLILYYIILLKNNNYYYNNIQYLIQFSAKIKYLTFLSYFINNKNILKDCSGSFYYYYYFISRK